MLARESSTCRYQDDNIPGIPGACTNGNFTYLVRGPWARKWLRVQHVDNYIFLMPPSLQGMHIGDIASITINDFMNKIGHQFLI